MRGWPLIFVLIAVSAIAAEWGPVKSSLGGNSVELTSAEKDLSMMWPKSVVPGDQLLLSKATYKRYGEKFFRQYRFVGVNGSSLQIQIQGGSSGKDSSSAPTDPSMNETIFVERASDGAFYFVPKDLKGEASFKIERALKEPGTYFVTLVRAK